MPLHEVSFRMVVFLSVFVIVAVRNFTYLYSFNIDLKGLPFEKEDLGVSTNVTWTLNMFEMDFDTHRKICLTGQSPLQNDTWPWKIDHTGSVSDPAVRDNVKIKFLGLYFPQWYEDPLNHNVNDWNYFRNPNFTHNANSLLIHRPLNHIYYDPRCLEHRRTQAALAKKYLLDGFLYYFYFPMNEWVLSAVQQLMLSDGEPSTDFAFYWVNAEFSDRKTRYDKPELLADVLLPFVKHPRYITIQGRPVLYVYFASWVPPYYMQSVQEILIENGVPKLYVVAAIQNPPSLVVKVDFADAYAEFPPNIGASLWQSYGYKKWDHTKDYHLGMTLNFDNTPRMSGGNPTFLPPLLSQNRTLPQKQPTPIEFQERCIARVRSWYQETKGEKVVTFFAWNEWSEQAALEPSDLYGYGYLEALRNCRLKVSDLEVS